MSTLTSKEYVRTLEQMNPSLRYAFSVVKREVLAMGILLGFLLGVVWSIALMSPYWHVGHGS